MYRLPRGWDGPPNSSVARTSVKNKIQLSGEQGSYGWSHSGAQSPVRSVPYDYEPVGSRRPPPAGAARTGSPAPAVATPGPSSSTAWATAAGTGPAGTPRTGSPAPVVATLGAELISSPGASHRHRPRRNAASRTTHTGSGHPGRRADRQPVGPP